jgi:hypothetical protein
MGQSSVPRVVLFAVSCFAPVLGGCAATNTGPGAVATDFDPSSTAARIRQSGAGETTLAAFCQNPPKTTNPAAAEAIKASCRPKVLALAGDAALFDKGDGLYPVVFKRPVRNGDICPTGTTPQSLCGNFSAGDTMRSSRIDAGDPT